MRTEEHDRAAQRLGSAQSEQAQLGDRYDDAIGTSSEVPAHARLRAAQEQVAARGAWLDWVNDENYQGHSPDTHEPEAESSDAAATDVDGSGTS
jgi:hypothetical protein